MQSREILLIDEAEDKTTTTTTTKNSGSGGNPDRQTNINIISLVLGVH